jgi:hypothetical protein
MKEVFTKGYVKEVDKMIYVHYQNGEAIRQIEVTPTSKVLLTSNNPKDYLIMDDQILNEAYLEPSNIIIEEEFDKIWNEE